MVSDDYIMGFVEGEGCFSVAIQKDIDYRPRKTGRKNKMVHKSIRFKVRPSFRITLAKKDENVIHLIKKKLDVGQIWIQSRKKYNENSQDTINYYVQKFSELIKIRTFFQNQTFHTTKGKDFKKWAKVLELMISEKHLQKEGFLEIIELRDQMNVQKGKTTMRLSKEIKSMLNSPEEHILAHKDTNQTQL